MLGCEDSLQKDLQRFHPNIATATEIGALAEIKTPAAKAENVMMTLMNMTQDREEGVSTSFVLFVSGRGKAFQKHL